MWKWKRGRVAVRVCGADAGRGSQQREGDDRCDGTAIRTGLKTSWRETKNMRAEHPPRHSNIQKPFFYLYRTRIPVSDNWIWNLISVSRSEPVGTKLFIAFKETVSLLTEYLTSLFQYYYLNPVRIYIRPWQPCAKP